MSIQTGPFGLLELAQGENVTIDIVALHGLDGHRETSWTADNGILWLRDLLPGRIPNARIFSYGYDVNTRGRDQLSTASLLDQGVNLIAHLASKRKSTATEERPLIFVTHSLGGIVLKSALIHASGCGEGDLPSHKAVEVSTSGILFFGTPHQGSDSAGLATVLLNILSAFGKATSGNVKDIQNNSKMLRQQFIQYQEISSRFDTKFYVESYKTPIGPLKTLLVPRSSAVIPGVVKAETIFLNKNHIDMVKFESAADGDFNLVASHLSIMVEEAPRKIIDRWKSQRGADDAIPEGTTRVHGALRERKSQKRVGGVEELAPLPELPYQEAGDLFVGRDQALAWVHESFKKHRTLVLYGIGGIGKTGIAVEYVYSHRRDYDIIFWVNGDTSESTTSGFIGIAQQLVKWRSYGSAAPSSGSVRNYHQTAYELGLDGFVDSRGKVSNKTEDRADILNSVKEWLSRPRSGTWLLIFDNVDDLESFNLAKFFPTPIVGRILITSRELESRFLGTGYEVTELGEDDSLQLLINRSQGGEADNAAREIVRRLGGLPLAIELAAAYISALQLSYKTYLEFSKEPWKSVFKRNIKPYGKSLVATWEVSYQVIATRSPSAANLLLLCAFLNNEDIPEQLFRGKFGANLNEALEQIFAFSLAKRSSTTPSFSIHPMVHAWALERLDEEQKTEKVLELVILLGDAISQTHVSSRHVSTCTRHVLEHCLPKLRAESDISIFQSLENIAECERGHLLRGMLLLALEVTERVEGPDSVQTFTAMNRLGGAYLRLADLQPGKFLQKALQHEGDVKIAIMLNPNKQPLQGRLGPHIQKSTEQYPGSYMVQLTDQEQWKEAERLCRCSLEGLGKILGLDHTSTLSATHYLAISFCRQGRLEEGLEFGQRAVEGHQKILGSDHPDTLRSFTTLAITLSELRRFEEAEILVRRVFERRETTLGLDHPHTLTSINNLAILLTELGRFDEAEMMARRALETRERTLGLDHPDTLKSVSNLAFSMRKLGPFEDAEMLDRRALESRERTLGLDHPDTLHNVHNLAFSLGNLGRFEDAETMYRRALESRERTLGLDHPDTLHSAHNLAITLRILNRFKEAEMVDRRVLESRQRTLGLDHPDTLQSVNNLAISLRGVGRFEETEMMDRRVLESRERTLGLDHPDTLQSITNLAILLRQLGRFDEAELMDRRALESGERTLGLDHPDTLSSVNNLANSLRALGRSREAEMMDRRALENRERTLGLDHPDTLTSVNNLANSLRALGRSREAEMMDRRALENRERTLGLDHPDTFSSVNNLAASLSELGQFDEAEMMGRRALESRERILGLDHPDTLQSISNLAILLRQLGRFDEAELMDRRALERRERTLGPDHPDTLQSVTNLGILFRQLGRFDEAELMDRRALERRERTLGPDHPDTLQSVNNLTVSLNELGRFEEAAVMDRRALESCERTLGLDHRDTIQSVHYLAISLRELGRFEEAEVMDRRVLESRERTLGLDHPDTLSSAHNLAITLRMLSRFREADMMDRRVLEGRQRILGLDHPDTSRSDPLDLAPSSTERTNFKKHRSWIWVQSMLGSFRKLK